MKILDKIFGCVLYFTSALILIMGLVSLIIKGNILGIIFGTLLLIFLIGAFIILVIREILYWASKRNNDSDVG